MSQANAGGPPPGWWQASDGNWYPPETHPQYQPPAAAPGSATIVVQGGVIPPAPGQSGWAPAVGSAPDTGQPAWGQQAPAPAQPAWGQQAPAAAQPAWGQQAPAVGGPAWGQAPAAGAQPQWGQPAGPVAQAGWGGPAVAAKPSGPPTKRRPFVLISILGAIATAIGSFLPWVTSSIGDTEVTINGLDDGGDGVITLVAAGLGLVFLLLAFLKRTRVFAILAFLCAGLAALTAWIDLADVRSSGDDLAGVIEFEIGYGLWIVAAGSTVMALFALIASLRKASA